MWDEHHGTGASNLGFAGTMPAAPVSGCRGSRDRYAVYLVASVGAVLAGSRAPCSMSGLESEGAA